MGLLMGIGLITEDVLSRCETMLSFLVFETFHVLVDQVKNILGCFVRVVLRCPVAAKFCWWPNSLLLV